MFSPEVQLLSNGGFKAILGTHGYKAHEVYDPVWRHVHVPQQFFQLVCPMAEEMISSLHGILQPFLLSAILISYHMTGRENLVGATNHWHMVVFLRPYLFQVRWVLTVS